MKAGNNFQQADLFAARGDRSKRPAGAVQIVSRLVAALDRRGWVGAATLCGELGIDRRTLREAGSQSGGAIVGHQRGYALTVQLPLTEVAAVVARHLSQSREQKRRALEIERIRHGACGDLGSVA